MGHLKKTAALLSTLAITLAGCDAAAAEIPQPTAVEQLPAETVRNLNEAGIKLYESMDAAQHENTFISPVSIYLAYAMLYNGAQGGSATEMRDNLFNFDKDLARQNGISLRLLELVSHERENVTLDAANSIWLDQSVLPHVREEFLTYSREHLSAKVETLDFADGASVGVINNWVKENTGGMIEEMVDTLTPNDMMYLLNALYLNAKWQMPFDAGMTVDGTFQAPGGDVPARMMTLRKPMEYFEDSTMQVARLPYADGETSMLVFLPKGDFASVRPFGELKALCGKLAERDVWLAMPKVNTDFSDDGTLQEAIMSNGVKSIFDPQAANLKGIADIKESPLFVGETHHKTALKIDEEGTEASAAISLGLMRGAITDSSRIIKMMVDKPFYCAIIDDASGAMLFCGCIRNPNA